MVNKGAQPLHSVYDPVTGMTMTVNADGSINISGSITASNPSVGPVDAHAPADATMIGYVNAMGDLKEVSTTSPLPVDVSIDFPASLPVTQQGTWAVELLDSSGVNKASISAAGAVKVDGSAVTQPVSAVSLPLPTGASTAANQATGNTSLASIATQTSHLPGSLGQQLSANSLPVVLPSDPDYRPVSGNITVQDTGSSTTTGQNGATIVTGVPTANSFQSWPINGEAGVGLLVSGTWTGTLAFEASFDGGTTWFTMSLRVRGVSQTAASVTGNGNFTGDVAAATHFRVRATAAMTGTATVKPTFSMLVGAVQVINPVKLFDNTSGANASIKTASTAPVGTDTSLVVAVNPNSEGTAGSASGGVKSVQGPTASGVSVAANPTTVGGRAATANPTAVADGQAVNTMHDKLGKLVAINVPRVLKGSQKTSLSNTTAEVTIVTAGGAGVFNDLYGLILANTGVTTTKIDIRDATAGSIIATLEIPTAETRGFTFPADSGFSQTTANNNWTAQCASATTALEVTALFVKNI